MVKIRQCELKDIDNVARLSKKVLKNLQQKGKSDLFGGVDESEIAAAMKFPSTVIVAEDENENIVGFLLLQKPNDEEEENYMKAFPNSYKVGEGIIGNGMGVDPALEKKGIATMMLEFANKYALEQGFTKFLGTIHPDNKASAGAVRHIADMEKGEPFIHKTRDGRNLLRQYLIQNLK